MAFGETPCFFATAMYMAKRIAAVALMVIEVETQSSGIPSNTVSMSFFFNVAAPTEIYTLSLHDALPIFFASACAALAARHDFIHFTAGVHPHEAKKIGKHTSELQSLAYLVCRLLLE